MAEGTRDTGFMLEWMFCWMMLEWAAIRLYYLLFSQDNKISEPENWNTICVCANARCAICAFTLSVYSLVHVLTCMCVQCHWMNRERFYLCFKCEFSHSSRWTFRAL